NAVAKRRDGEMEGLQDRGKFRAMWSPRLGIGIMERRNYRRRSHMRSLFSSRVGISLVVVFIACAMLPTDSRAGLCTAKITRLQARVDDAIDAHAGAGSFGREGLRATRSWQPTPKSIAHADKRVSGWKGGLR